MGIINPAVVLDINKFKERMMEVESAIFVYGWLGLWPIIVDDDQS